MWKRLKDIFNEVDAVMITSAPNLRYFSGFCGGEGVCLIGDGFRYLFVDSRYTVAAKAEARDFEVIEYKGGKLCNEINSKLSAHLIENLGFEDREMTAAEFETYREKLNQKTMTGLGNRLTVLRMIKTDEEIRLMKAAEDIGDMAFAEVLPMIKAGVSECEIAAELEYGMRRRGADKTSFDTIVVSGVKSSMPHGMPSSKKLERGDFVTMDFGCVYNGYCSDMTRTVVIETASDKQIKIYNTVLKAQLEGLCAIRAGIKGKDADSAARKIISDAGYGDCFGHSLGHGVGLEIHELPNLSPSSDITLCENMIVTCEPGIYVDGLGGVRIEDMVAVTKDGCLNLASSPKELIICG